MLRIAPCWLYVDGAGDCGGAAPVIGHGVDELVHTECGWHAARDDDAGRDVVAADIRGRDTSEGVENRAEGDGGVGGSRDARGG